MIDLGIDPHRAVHDYDWQTARRMQSRAFKVMAADLKKALGRGYKVRVVEEGDVSSRHGWNWKMFVVLLVTAPKDAWEQEVSVVLNIADTESSGNVSTKDAGVLPAGRSDKPEVVWERLRETAVSVLAPERTHRRNAGTELKAATDDQLWDSYDQTNRVARRMGRAPTQGGGAIRKVGTQLRGELRRRGYAANDPGVTMDDLTALHGMQLTEPNARKVLDAIKDAPRSGRGAQEVFELTEELIKQEGEYLSFGVESATGPGDRSAMYLNTGDSYSATLLYDEDEGEWYVTTWGDWQGQVEQKYAGDVGQFWVIPYTIETEGSMPDKLFAIVQSPTKEDAVTHFVESAVAMGDDTVWADHLGGSSPEQADGQWYATVDHPDADLEDDDHEPMVVYLTVGEPDQPWRTMEEARYETRGDSVLYEHTED
jgi:hypothetical protein